MQRKVQLGRLLQSKHCLESSCPICHGVRLSGVFSIVSFEGSLVQSLFHVINQSRVRRKLLRDELAILPPMFCARRRPAKAFAHQSFMPGSRKYVRSEIDRKQRANISSTHQHRPPRLFQQAIRSQSHNLGALQNTGFSRPPGCVGPCGVANVVPRSSTDTLSTVDND